MKKAKKENSESEVTIHIGLIRLKDGELKVIRGSTLPLKVLPSIGAEELLRKGRKGTEKIVKFNSDLSLYGATSFALLYPDRTEVKCLPGGMETFTLQRPVQRRTWEVLQPDYLITLQENNNLTTNTSTLCPAVTYTATCARNTPTDCTVQRAASNISTFQTATANISTVQTATANISTVQTIQVQYTRIDSSRLQAKMTRLGRKSSGKTYRKWKSTVEARTGSKTDGCRRLQTC